MAERRIPAECDVILLGCGKMGSALANGWVDGGAVESDQLYVCDREDERASTLAEETEGRSVSAEDAFDVEGDRRIFVAAVKPGDIESLLASGRASFQAGDTVVSIAAGMPTELLLEWVGSEPAVVRAMPNTPALVGRGMTGVYDARGADLSVVRALFEGVGRVVVLEKEAHFDALTAVSGSGPAYVFTAIEALADGAVSEGLDRETAIALAVETLLGSAALAKSSDAHSAELKDAVASPGGTTVTGLTELERQGFRSALIEAVRAAAGKSEEMTADLLDDS